VPLKTSFFAFAPYSNQNKEFLSSLENNKNTQDKDVLPITKVMGKRYAKPGFLVFYSG